MKKFFIILLFSICCSSTFSQNWITINKAAPYYSFSFPASPHVMDTMNIRLSWLKKSDSITVFQVFEFKDTPLDTANSAFNNALQETSGDTLLAIAKSISVTNNFVITNTQNINTFPAYKGLEVGMRYTDAASGKVILVFTRFFYNVHTLLTFSVTGQEDHFQPLQSDKDLFFNSIAFGAAN